VPRLQRRDGCRRCKQSGGQFTSYFVVAYRPDPSDFQIVECDTLDKDIESYAEFLIENWKYRDDYVDYEIYVLIGDRLEEEYVRGKVQQPAILLLEKEKETQLELLRLEKYRQEEAAEKARIIKDKAELLRLKKIYENTGE
jgi:hypothetical protein